MVLVVQISLKRCACICMDRRIMHVECCCNPRISQLIWELCPSGELSWYWLEKNCLNIVCIIMCMDTVGE